MLDSEPSFSEERRVARPLDMASLEIGQAYLLGRIMSVVTLDQGPKGMKTLLLGDRDRITIEALPETEMRIHTSRHGTLRMSLEEEQRVLEHSTPVGLLNRTLQKGNKYKLKDSILVKAGQEGSSHKKKPTLLLEKDTTIQIASEPETSLRIGTPQGIFEIASEEFQTYLLPALTPSH